MAPPPKPVMKPARVRLFSLAATLMLAALSVPHASLAQQPKSETAKPETMQDILRRAQTEGERKAIEDLIGKLQKGRSASPPEVPAATSSAAPPTTTATAIPAAVPTAPPGPAPLTPPATPPPAVETAAPVQPLPQTVPQAVPPPAPVIVAVPVQAPAVAPPPAAPPAAAPPPVARATEVAARENLPSVDLEIYFAFASAEITPAATATLVTLGRTLSDPRLQGQSFVIGGFTDGKGKPDYNLRLSQMRADAVRTFLIRGFAIEPQRLIAKGFGQGRLKNATNPQADENRRVQIINWTDKLGATP